MRYAAALMLSMFSPINAFAAPDADFDWGMDFFIYSTVRCNDPSMNLEQCHDGQIIQMIKTIEVAEVNCYGSAKKAGMRAGDVIISINGVTVAGLSAEECEKLQNEALNGVATMVVRRRTPDSFVEKTFTLESGPSADDPMCPDDGIQL